MLDEDLCCCTILLILRCLNLFVMAALYCLVDPPPSEAKLDTSSLASSLFVKVTSIACMIQFIDYSIYGSTRAIGRDEGLAFNVIGRRLFFLASSSCEISCEARPLLSRVFSAKEAMM